MRWRRWWCGGGSLTPSLSRPSPMPSSSPSPPPHPMVSSLLTLLAVADIQRWHGGSARWWQQWRWLYGGGLPIPHRGPPSSLPALPLLLQIQLWRWWWRRLAWARWRPVAAAGLGDGGSIAQSISPVPSLSCVFMCSSFWAIWGITLEIFAR